MVSPNSFPVLQVALLIVGTLLIVIIVCFPIFNATSPGFLASQAAVGPIVTLPTQGQISGYLSSLGVAVFLGIPYAQPPVGDLRWRSPEPALEWNGTRSATVYAPICPQFQSSWASAGYQQSEDCLYLNVYSPVDAISYGASLPVLVWITGGGFVVDTPDNYPGDEIVRATRRNVVVVEMAYRLNVFGFMASSDLLDRDPGVGSLGILDQQMALQWVQDNIAGFGGDPGRVTIFGQSSGAASVMNHLVRNASYSLYRGAIMESGMYSEQVSTMDQATNLYNFVLNQVGCSDLDCLLQVDTNRLIAAGEQAAQNQTVFTPLLDNNLLPSPPWELIKAGQYNNKVPVIIGSCRDEMAHFMATTTGNKTWPNNMGNKTYESLILQIWNFSEANYTHINWAYESEQGYDLPPEEARGGFDLKWWKLMRMRTDDNFGHCAERWLAQALHEGGTPSVYLYVFGFPWGSPFVGHSSEVFYIFEDGGDPLNQALTNYWANFAADGNPNGIGDNQPPVWPAFSNTTDLTQMFVADYLLSTSTRVAEKYRYHACKFWDNWHNEHGFHGQVAPNVSKDIFLSVAQTSAEVVPPRHHGLKSRLRQAHLKPKV